MTPRVLIITHLCLGLSCLLWLLGYPFMGGHYTLHSELLLIESVMGTSDTLERIDPAKKALLEPKFHHYGDYFKNLPETTQNEILTLHSIKKSALNAPFAEKIALFRRIPVLEILWILFSVGIPILLLLRTPYAFASVWLLPLLTLGYAINNQMYGLDPLKVSDKALFPREESLAQAPTLKEAWENYLTQNWSRDLTLANGEFHFNLERLKRLTPSLSTPFWEKKSPLLLLLFLFWNGYFAFKLQQKGAL